MIATFLVALDLDEAADLLGMAEQLQEDLADEGYTVSSIKPWDRAALTMQSLSQPMPEQPLGSTLGGASQLFPQ
jgi:hypothetical protein